MMVLHIRCAISFSAPETRHDKVPLRYELQLCKMFLGNL